MIKSVERNLTAVRGLHIIRRAFTGLQQYSEKKKAVQYFWRKKVVREVSMIIRAWKSTTEVGKL